MWACCTTLAMIILIIKRWIQRKCKDLIQEPTPPQPDESNPVQPPGTPATPDSSRAALLFQHTPPPLQVHLPL